MCVISATTVFKLFSIVITSTVTLFHSVSYQHQYFINFVGN